jgi:hypothetical protein
MELCKQSGPTKVVAKRTTASAGPKERALRKKGPPLRLVELRSSYLLLTCARQPYDQCGGIFSKIRENVCGFARKVPSASEPKARVTSAR